MLGPLAVWTDDGTPVTVPDRKVRVLLADLLAHDGRPVSADRLVDDLWGDRPPRDPVGTLQARVSQLRTTLERAEPGGRALVTYGPTGYALHLAGPDLAIEPYTVRVADPAAASAGLPAAVDADRFRELVRRARAVGDPRVREDLLAEALGLWRGPAYVDTPSGGGTGELPAAARGSGR